MRMRIGVIIKAFGAMLVLTSALVSQDRGFEFVSGPEFHLSDAAIAAGIDGTLTVSFKVERTGTVSNVRILAGPTWPCNSSPDDELKQLRRAVRENILAAKFLPAMRNGKTISSEATLDFIIGEAYEEALKGRTTSKSRWIVDAASLPAEVKPVRIPTPLWSGIWSTVSVRVVISESGEVIAAGAIRGHPALHRISRRAACDAEFPPTIVGGKAIKVSGMIHYDFSRGRVRAR